MKNFLLTIFALMLLGCGKAPQSDKNGDFPKDVFAKFLKAVDEGNVEQARSYWDNEPNITNGGGKGEFIKDVFDWWGRHDQVKIVGSYQGVTETSGRTFYHVVTECYIDGKKVHWPEPALQLLDNEWKICRNIWW